MCVHDKALYKSTFTFTFTFTLLPSNNVMQVADTIVQCHNKVGAASFRPTIYGK